MHTAGLFSPVLQACSLPISSSHASCACGIGRAQVEASLKTLYLPCLFEKVRLVGSDSSWGGDIFAFQFAVAEAKYAAASITPNAIGECRLILQGEQILLGAKAVYVGVAFKSASSVLSLSPSAWRIGFRKQARSIDMCQSARICLGALRCVPLLACIVT